MSIMFISLAHTRSNHSLLGLSLDIPNMIRSEVFDIMKDNLATSTRLSPQKRSTVPSPCVVKLDPTVQKSDQESRKISSGISKPSKKPTKDPAGSTCTSAREHIVCSRRARTSLCKRSVLIPQEMGNSGLFTTPRPSWASSCFCIRHNKWNGLLVFEYRQILWNIRQRHWWGRNPKKWVHGEGTFGSRWKRIELRTLEPASPPRAWPS